MGKVFAGGAVSGRHSPQGDEPTDLGGLDVVERRRALEQRLARHLGCGLGHHRLPLWRRSERDYVADHDLYMPPDMSTP
jgi:hypothetical protein